MATAQKSKTKPTEAAPTTATVYPLGLKVRIVPNEQRTEMPWPDHLPVPQIGTFEWKSQGDGTFKPVIRLQPVWVKMHANVTQDLGINITYHSLRRLMTGGFIRQRQITPGQFAFDLQSFFQHCAKVEADPEFWTGENLKRYMEAI